MYLLFLSRPLRYFVLLLIAVAILLPFYTLPSYAHSGLASMGYLAPNLDELDVVQIAAGHTHTCVLTSDSAVLCWGDNSDGQLGNGSTADSSTPQPVSGLSSGVSAIAAGQMHTCALVDSGAVLCWGANENGQLGDGSTTDSIVPATMDNLPDTITAIAAGQMHTCALASNGNVFCWGNNSNGQLGDGNFLTDSNRPVAVSGLPLGVVAVSAGFEHTCAITSDGDVFCWGDNSLGQLGDDILAFSSTPVAVSNLGSDVTSISTGTYFTCALTSSSGVLCWGDNEHGQLGDGTIIESRTPVAVNGLSSGVTVISVGNDHACALTDDAGVLCWGNNSRGQLGDGTTKDISTPITVSGLPSDVIIISSGYAHTCASTDSNGLFCWGDNYFGQLGGAAASSIVPQAVENLPSDVTSITSGYTHSCAHDNGGEILCWGDNSRGQLGDGSTTDSSTPVSITGLSSSLTAISAGGGHTCAVSSGGGLYCWGSNWRGELGNDIDWTSSVPIAINGLSSDVTAMSAGDGHICALTSNGGTLCWGENANGELGNGSTSSSSTPVLVSGLLSDVTAISAGGFHTCALTSSVGVLCWGNNFRGELGNGTLTDSSAPVAVSGLLNGITEISAGFKHTCALTGSGGVLCWGDNRAGQLGDGTTEDSSTPVAVSGLSTVVAAISAGETHTCARTNDGRVLCWGDNSHGQLGDGTTTSSIVPTEVKGLSRDVIAISTGDLHTCAIVSSGAVFCWGSNGYGQLGDGRLLQSSIPLTVVPTSPCYSLSFNDAGISASPTNSTGCQSGEYTAGQSITLIASPPSGDQVSGWSGTNNDNSTATTNSLMMPDVDHTVGITYTLTMDEYEPDGTCAEAKTIQADGSPQTHTFHRNGDVDWLKFSTDPTGSYQIEVDVPSGSPADVVLELYADCDSLPREIWDERFTTSARMELNNVALEEVYLRLSNADENVSGEDVAYQVFVTKKEDPQGALILVAGRLRGGDQLQDNIHSVTNHVQELFLSKGLTDDDIFYLATDSSLPGYDAPATTERLEQAITEWASQRVNNDGALTLYLIDHGGRDVFYLDDLNNEQMTPTMLDEWLTTFEELVPDAKVNVIIEACNSGSFIDGSESVSKAGRVIITSTNVENDAYASRNGAYFSDQFLLRLQRNFNLFYSFQRSQETVSDLNSLQKPWLDADGNGIPNEREDELIASQRGFSYAGSFTDVWPPYIVTAQQPSAIVDGRGTLEVEVRDNEGVDSVWALIYPPSYVPPPNGDQLVAETLDTVLLQSAGDDRYRGSYPGFTESGIYRVIIHAKDQDDLQAEPKVLTVQTQAQNQTQKFMYLPFVSE